jgi:putative Mn2+ efflux pump MntP
VLLTYFLVGAGLTMDAFAVSVSSGMCVRDLRFGHALRASLSFGLFQFGMPVLGWSVGYLFKDYIAAIDHFVAFGLLAAIGGKMLFEAIRGWKKASCDDDEGRTNIKRLRTLILLSIATSIDALAVGVGYSLLGTPILLPAAIIGLTTLAFCLLGFEFGKRIGARLKDWAEVVGGLVLIGIGTEILVEHLAG